MQRYGATLCLRRERRRAGLAAHAAARLRCVRAGTGAGTGAAALISIEPSFARFVRFAFGSAFAEIRLLRRAATRGKESSSEATP
jgi:hypothetical protein